MTIILCGLPACGKTTIGQLLAKTLSWHFIDSDRLIEQTYAQKNTKNLTCRQIYLQEGEVSFRALERTIISSLQNKQHVVIAIGGGALLYKENTITLKTMGTLVYLKTPLNIIWERLCLNGLPAYLDPNNPKEAFETLVKKRIPLYEKQADLCVDVLNNEAIVSTILKAIEHGK